MFIARELIDRGCSVFLDIDSLHSANFDEQLCRFIEQCTDMILLLPPRAMDRCKPRASSSAMRPRNTMLQYRSLRRAVSWYQKAASQGMASAQKHLGYCYEHGLGVDQNCKTAFEYYQQSADQGFAEAQYCVGNCYQYGYGVERNLRKAAEYYQTAAGQGCSEAEKALKALTDAGMILPRPAENSRQQLP